MDMCGLPAISCPMKNERKLLLMQLWNILDFIHADCVQFLQWSPQFNVDITFEVLWKGENKSGIINLFRSFYSGYLILNTSFDNQFYKGQIFVTNHWWAWSSSRCPTYNFKYIWTCLSYLETFLEIILPVRSVIIFLWIRHARLLVFEIRARNNCWFQLKHLIFNLELQEFPDNFFCFAQ
jgi:hypothetical protein